MSKTSWNYDDKESYLKWFNGQKKYTANRNARKLQQFCGWIKKTPEVLIEEYQNTEDKNVWQRERKKEIEGFYNHLIEKGFKINSARSMPSGVLSFYSRNCETVRDATKVFAPPQIPENELIFTQDMLRKGYSCADLEGKTLLSLATCLGYSSADFLALECEKLSNLVKEAEDNNLEFIQFIGKSRAKTSIQPRSHLTPEAIHNLSDYLSVNEKKHGKLPRFLWFSDDLKRHITNEGLNKRVRRYLKDANIETYGKKVSFHLFRKFLYSNLQAKNRDLAKVIIAKKVPASDLTYIQNINAECLRVFKETYKQISLNGNLNGKARARHEERIKNLENSIVALSKDLQASKTISETLTKKMIDNERNATKMKQTFDRLEESLTDIKSHVAHTIEFGNYTEAEKAVLRAKYEIKEWDQDTKELLHFADDLFNEIAGEKGHMTAEESKEFNEQFQEYLKEWLKTHEFNP